ncbi:tRNA(Glu)-specific nuclease WapA precursor [Thalassoglobus neptunius]|uniref:tRNA(Glu)-specific nuclease WapA n=1 Tax=Thalassoglobus neptunius TaxID=1938619 RepID=A0A5C5V8V7_9PLAN|nr:RHS repeat-associated core domain-containing protein [Thalassoglobus neptunius]TWT35026.1 tRNA(Glu)-specific nuclease WapA precursor [Thalassoglobus neptunius]
MTPVWVSENGNPFPINRLRHSQHAGIGEHCYEEGPLRGDAERCDLQRARQVLHLDSGFVGGKPIDRVRIDSDGRWWSAGGYTNLYVTLPDGTREGFLFSVENAWTSQGLDPGFADLLGPKRPVFIPHFGTQSQLYMDDVLLVQGTTDGEYWSTDGSGGVVEFNSTNPFFGGKMRLVLRNGTELELDAITGELRAIEDQVGNRLIYDKFGITHEQSGRGITFERDQNDRISAVIDPSGNRIEYGYDPVTGDLLSMTDRLDATTQFTYDETRPHYLKDIVDPLGRVAARSEYDSQGRLERVIDADGKETIFTYAIEGDRTQTITDQLGNVTQITLDLRGNPIKTVSPEGVITLQSFDDDDNLLTETVVVGEIDDDVNGETNDLVTTHKYKLNQRTETIDPHGNVSTWTYTPSGQLKSQTDPLGNTAINEYDDFGRLSKTTDPNGNVLTYSYDPIGVEDKLNGIHPLQSAPIGIYDGDGNLLVHNTYNEFGELTKTVAVTFSETRFYSNPNILGGPRFHYTYFEGEVANFTYDDNGNRIRTWKDSSIVGPAGDQTILVDHSTYDSAGNVIGTSRVRDDAWGYEDETLWTTSSEYNLVGQLIGATDRNGLRTELTYDSRGQQIQTRQQALDESGNTVWFVSRTVYDAAGRVIASTSTYEEGTSEPIDGTLTFYDKDGRVERTEQVQGIQIDISGSGEFLSASVTNSGTLLNSRTTTYDSVGRVELSIDSNGLESRTVYGQFGAVIESRRQAIDELGYTVWIYNRTVYDSHGRPQFSSDQILEGSSNPVYGSRIDYDQFGRSYRTARLEGLIIEVYDVTTGLAVTDTIAAVAAGITLNTRIVDSGIELTSSSTEYDEKGQVSRQISADGQATSFEYDSLGRQSATISHPLPVDEVGITGQPPGTLVSLRSETVYDKYSRVEKNRTNIHQFLLSDGSIVIDDSQVRETTYEFNEVGQVSKTIFADGSFITTEYDDFGRKISETNQLGLTRRFEYDAQGRLSRLTLPDLDGDPNTTDDIASYEYGYDAQGNQTLLVDPLGHETLWAFDENGQELTRTLPLGFGADGISGTDDDSILPEGDFTESYEYDERGRRTLHVSFEGVVTQFVYDDVKGLIEQRFFDNLAQYNAGNGTPIEVWRYVRDAFGRDLRIEQEVTSGTTRIVENSYDAQGRLIAVSSPEGVIGYSYDQHGRRTQTTLYAPGADPTQDVPGRVTFYTYDSLGRLASVTEDSDPSSTLDALLSTHYRYDLVGNLDLTLLPNGVAEDYVYDSLNRLELLTHYRTDGTLEDTEDFTDDLKLAEFDYVLQDDGRRAGLIERFYNSVGVETFSNTYGWDYDALSRLVRETFTSSGNLDSYTTEYTFDLTGNRLTRETDFNGDNIADEAVSYIYDANDRLNREFLDKSGVSDDRTTFYTYDQTQQTGKAVFAGEHASPPTGTLDPLTTTEFAYDLQGRMSFVRTETRNSGGTLTRIEEVTYDYDSSGIRISAEQKIDTDADSNWDSHTRTEFLVDHRNFTGYQQTIRETVRDGLSQVIKVVDYTFGHDEITQTTTEGGSSTTLVFGHDGHGSVRLLTDLAGAVATLAGIEQIFVFDAYGDLLSMQPTQAGTSLLYSGESFDSRIGQQYLRARWYDAQTGRFNRLDPFFGNQEDPQSFHKYLYTHADPINGIDPTGQFAMAATIGMASLSANLGVGGATPAGKVWKFSRAKFDTIFPGQGVAALFQLPNNPAQADWFFRKPVNFWESLIPIWGPLRSAAVAGVNGDMGNVMVNLLWAGLDVVAVGGAVRALPGVVRSVASIGTNIATTSGGALIQRFGGLVVRKVGNYFIKTVDPDAAPVVRWFAQHALDEQVRALTTLGSDAPAFIFRNGKLVIRDIGNFSGSFLDWVGRFAAASRKLGTIFNDVLPRNIGANGQIFDPALTSFDQIARATLTEMVSIFGKTRTWLATYND